MLPPLLVLTDRGQAGAPLPEVVAEAADHGARAVLLREKDLPEAERAELADQLRTVLEPVDGVLVVAGPAGCAGGSSAVHLSARDPFPVVRPPLVGRSCHSRAELRQAAAERCDWVLLSPVFPSASKPGYGPALGPGGLRALLDAVVGPVPPAYALGGVTPTDVAACLAGGARGVAVMGPVMRRPALVSEYLAALSGG